MIKRIARNFGLYEVCFYVEMISELSAEELKNLLWVIRQTFEPLLTYENPSYKEGSILEIGPRLNVETPFSTNAVAICHAMGLKQVTRIEYSKVFNLAGTSEQEILRVHLDQMTQMVYPAGGILSFDSGLVPQEVQIVPVLEQGEDAIRLMNEKYGLGMDSWDIAYYTKLFLRLNRNPTDVEMVQIGNANSNHSRHWDFKAKLVIDGEEKPESLLDIVRAPLNAIRVNNVSILAFNDNVGAISGHLFKVFVPANPGGPSFFKVELRVVNPTATAETHNHPSLISPFGGQATKLGGRIRDNNAGGRGSRTGMGIDGECFGNLHIPSYVIPGEVVGGESSDKYAPPLRALLEGVAGFTRYGNQYGEPLTGGFTRTAGLIVSGERREFIKPVAYGGGIGHIDGAHLKKHTPGKRMLIVRFGGPAYDIGFCGGSASSMSQGDNDADRDYKSVQRGNGEYGHKAACVIFTCIEAGDENPIESLHDQGAGGPSNVLTELMEMIGGKVDIRHIVLGDKTMAVIVIWSAEYQEGYGVLIRPEKLELFKSFCERERVNCEVLGEITEDGYVTVIDSRNNTTPVHLPLPDILGKLPQKTFRSEHLPRKFNPPDLPKNLRLETAIEMTLKQVSVGSKGFIINQADASVGGRVARQQRCGPSQVPIADVQVLADGYFGLTGVVSAVGEQPLKMLIDPKAGARMSVGEMLTNMMAAGGIKLSDVRCRANWMWPAKMPGEGALVYDAAVAMRDVMIALGIACDGGKDSFSMVATVNGERVKSPGELVILGYASLPDITNVLTPDIKMPGESYLGLIDLGLGRNRLGGSAFLQAQNQLGDESPDYDPELLKATWRAIQILHDCGAILSLHDRSEGGLAAAVIEMCLGGNSGVFFNSNLSLDFLFAEELGLVIEFNLEDRKIINQVLEKEGVPPLDILGQTTWPNPSAFGIPLPILRQWWEETSHQIDRLQSKNGTADEEFAGHAKVVEPYYYLGFNPKPVAITEIFRPKVAVVREEGTNGDREMAAALFTAGLDPMDIHMSDLLAGKITLDQFQGLVFPGGFSFMDVFDSAKGWAAVIKFNAKLREMFDRFYDRKDTFSLGVCNGCQLMALLGWVPWKGLDEKSQPRFVHNRSGRFESRWVQVAIQPSPSILLAGMEGSTLGVHVAHGEGRLVFPDPEIMWAAEKEKLIPLVYVDSENEPTEKYPANPNGSVMGITALCSRDGRHLAMMPHPERCFLPWQCHYWPPEWAEIKVAPWLQMFQNARTWCLQNN